MDKLYGEICNKIGVNRKAGKYLTQSLSLFPYKSLVSPRIDYIVIVYMRAKNEALDKLQRAQNVACRVILKAGLRGHIRDMHKELGLLPLKDK